MRKTLASLDVGRWNRRNSERSINWTCALVSGEVKSLIKNNWNRMCHSINQKCFYYKTGLYSHSHIMYIFKFLIIFHIIIFWDPIHRVHSVQTWNNNRSFFINEIKLLVLVADAIENMFYRIPIERSYSYSSKIRYSNSLLIQILLITNSDSTRPERWTIIQGLDI